jgi:hypothetical protein
VSHDHSTTHALPHGLANVPQFVLSDVIDAMMTREKLCSSLQCKRR